MKQTYWKCCTLIAVLLLPACVTPDQPTHKPLKPGELPKMESRRGLVGKSHWLGMSEKKLLAGRGKPDYIFAVPSGIAYVYEQAPKDKGRDIRSSSDCKDTYLFNHIKRVVSYFCR